MAASVDLTSKANVKEYLGISGTDDDDFIDNLIDRASEAIESHCRREFNSEERTEYHDGRGSSRLVLKHRPVTAVASIYDDLNRDFGSGTLISSSDYLVREDEGIVEFVSSSSFKDGRLNVKVTYTGGYSTIPTDLGQACIMLVALLYHRGKQGADGIKQESQAGAYSVTYVGMLMTPEITALLASYREYKI